MNAIVVRQFIVQIQINILQALWNNDHYSKICTFFENTHTHVYRARDLRTFQCFAYYSLTYDVAKAKGKMNERGKKRKQVSIILFPFVRVKMKTNVRTYVVHMGLKIIVLLHFF